MTIRNFLTVSILTAGILLPAYGLDIEMKEKGTLNELVAAPAEVTELTVSGPVDASDLYFIGSEMPKLTDLDLSNATIETYFGVLLNGRSKYPENMIPEGAFAGLPLVNVVFPQTEGLIIGDGAFVKTALTSLTIPATVDSVGNSAFAANANLSAVTMPGCRVGTSLFSECTGLTTVNLNGVTVIPASTFRGCTALETVAGADKVVSVGSRAFEGDISLTEFDFGKDLAYIGDAAFAGTSLTNANLSATKLGTLGAQAFANADLDAISLPEGLAEIGSGALFGNGKIEEIELPASLIAIGDHSLTGTALSLLELPVGLEEIGNYALYGQKNIDSILVPSTVLYIGSHAMEGMTGLKSINVTNLEHVPELGEGVWEGLDQKAIELYVLNPYVDDYGSADQWKEFTIIGSATGVDDVTADGDATMSVRGRFVGTDLHIESTGSDIAAVRLYDTAGRLLATAAPGAATAVVETADYPGGVFIVGVVLADNTPATLKIARR